MARPPSKMLRLLGALTLTLGGLAITATAEAAPSPTACEKFLEKPQRAQDVRSSNPSAFARAGTANGKNKEEWDRMANDSSLWVDHCGRAFFVEPLQASAASATETPVTAVRPLSETFMLESKPGSARTIYLDFEGETVANTAWNANYAGNAPITVPAYSIDTDASTFSSAELTEIQRTWQIVAEDYAPFDVNVTTRDPGLAAIDRTSSSDLVYGSRVLFSTSDAVYSSCSCGGIAYVNVFNTSGTSHMYYQPAWVFTKGVGTGAKNMAEAASHEAGHNFGLNHDGTSTQGYYGGAAPWAPIMGVGYSQPVSQWSRGEYAGANNAQDDLAVIATGAPLRADDFADSTSTAFGLSAGDVRNGLIGSTADRDVFKFTAVNATSLTVTPAPLLGNLDVQLTILDSQGTAVAVIDPAVARVSPSSASGLDAAWSFQAPAAGTVYYAVVDGVGTGDPLTAGKYSDYGSLGNYQIALSTGTITATPVTVSAQTLPAGEAGRAYSAQLSATGGDGSYVWSATGVPAGLTVSSSGLVSGTPTTAGTYSFTATAASAGSSSSAPVSLTVNAAPVVAEPLAWLDDVTSLPNGATGKPYTATVGVKGGRPAYVWSRSGNLPTGLSATVSADQKSLVISGTAKKKGTYRFSYKVADGAGTAITRTFTLTIV